jgi:Holliday junction DNA helicase RuvA
VIGRLSGAVVERHGDGSCVVEVAGVGYEVFVPARSLAVLPRPPEQVTLHVHTHVREDALVLYGFAGPDDRAAFRALLAVSGIGPRTALGIVGELTVRELCEAVARGDKRRLTSVDGVGAKTAERLTLELRDKLPALGAAGANGTSVSGGVAAVGVPITSTELAVVDALVRLGFGRGEAEGAVAKVTGHGEPAPVETMLRRALATLS